MKIYELALKSHTDAPDFVVTTKAIDKEFAVEDFARNLDFDKKTIEENTVWTGEYE